MRVVGEREREIIRPGETLQPGRTAIKTRIRDEASGVCLSAGAKRGRSHLLAIVGAPITAIAAVSAAQLLQQRITSEQEPLCLR